MPYDFSKIKKRSDEVYQWLKKEFASLHTGRANPALVEDILVEAYGTRNPLKQVAAIGIEDARTIRITPWDPSISKNIEHALSKTNLGGQPIAESGSVRFSLPELTEERRALLVKLIHKKLEEAKVSLRKERDEVWKDIQEKEREGEITEDDKYRYKDELQEIFEEAVKELEGLAKRKEEEVIKR